MGRNVGTDVFDASISESIEGMWFHSEVAKRAGVLAVFEGIARSGPRVPPFPFTEWHFTHPFAVRICSPRTTLPGKVWSCGVTGKAVLKNVVKRIAGNSDMIAIVFMRF